MRASQILERMECGACITDVEAGGFPLVWSNEHFELITGYPADFLVGRDPWFLHSGLCPEAEHEMKSLVAEGRPCRGIIQIRRADGTLLWVEVTGYPAPFDGSLRLVGLINAWTPELQRRFARLSPQQERLFSLLANGATIQQAGHAMQLTYRFAYMQASDIERKLRIKSPTELYLLHRH